MGCSDHFGSVWNWATVLNVNALFQDQKHRVSLDASQCETNPNKHRLVLLLRLCHQFDNSKEIVYKDQMNLLKASV